MEAVASKPRLPSVLRSRTISLPCLGHGHPHHLRLLSPPYCTSRGKLPAQLFASSRRHGQRRVPPLFLLPRRAGKHGFYPQRNAACSIRVFTQPERNRANLRRLWLFEIKVSHTAERPRDHHRIESCSPPCRPDAARSPKGGHRPSSTRYWIRTSDLPRVGRTLSH